MAYDPTKDDTKTGTTPGDYETTGAPNQLAILRKINLNVDIATQEELNAAYNDLSTQIVTATSAYIPADQQLCSDLQAWAKGAELSGALHNEITAETDRAETAEEAIRADLSNNYKVTVVKDDTPETSAYIASYTIKQGETALSPKINIPKDYVVKSAELCTVTTAGEPYPEAQVGDKYIDFVVNTADQGDAKHIYLPVNDLVDVYTGGTTEFATVNVDSNRVITTNVSADLISAAAVDEVVGTSEDLSTAMTINGVKKYVDEKVADKNVDAEGDVYVSASAADNKVTVAATAELCAAVANANAAVQDIVVDSGLTALIDVQDEGTTQYLHATDKLTAAVDAAETALQSIGNGTDGEYVTTTIGTKESNEQTVGVAVTVAALTAGDNGLAEATDVKQYVDGKITDLSVSAAGDAYVTASSTGKAITVAAADRTKAAIDKVEAASATWDNALQNILTSTNGQFIRTAVGTKTDNEQSFSVSAVTHEVSSAVAGESDGLVVASDAKAYVDAEIAKVDDAFVKGVDTETTAYINIGGDPELTGSKIINVNLTQASRDAIDDVANKAYISDLTAEATERQNNDRALSTAIDNLSGAYVDKTTYDNAAADLNDAIAISALSDYQDIDAIITELENLKSFVKTFATSTKQA